MDVNGKKSTTLVLSTGIIILFDYDEKRGVYPSNNSPKTDCNY